MSSKFIKILLKIIRTAQTDKNNDILIIEYCIDNFDKFNEYSKRILWLISLYKPSQEQIQAIANIFDFSVIQFQKAFQRINI